MGGPPITTGIILALAAALSVAVAHTLAKDVLDKLPIIQFYAVRTGAGAITTFVAVAGSGDLVPMLQLPPAKLALLFGSGLLVPLAVNLMSFWSMKRMPLNVHAPLFRTYVMDVAILSLIFLDEKWTPLMAAGIAITFIGVVAFSAARQPGGRKHVSPAPILVCLAGAIGMAVGKILWKTMGSFASSSMIAFAGTMSAAVIFTVAYLIARPPTGPPSAQFKAIVSGSVVFAGGNLLTIMAMKHIAVPVVSTIHSTSTLIIAALAYLFLGERWTRAQAMAAITICVGIALLFFR